MARQTHITLPLLLFLGFGISIIDCNYQMPTVETIPSGDIERTIGDRLMITCRVIIYVPKYRRPDTVPELYRKFFLTNCTSRERQYSQVVSGSDVSGRDDCNQHDSNTISCTYEWPSEEYTLNSEGDYALGCMNYADEQSDGCEGVDLLQVTVSKPALPSTQTPSTTTVSPTVSDTITTSATTSLTSTAPETTFPHTSYGDGGSSNSVTAGSRYLTFNPVSTQPTVERRSKDAVNTVTGGSSASNSTSDHHNSGRKGSQLTLIMPPVLFLFIVVMAALLAMFWKCRRRRSSGSVV